MLQNIKSEKKQLTLSILHLFSIVSWVIIGS